METPNWKHQTIWTAAKPQVLNSRTLLYRNLNLDGTPLTLEN